MPVRLILNASIAGSGAPTIISGSGLGIASITRLVAGVYRIQLQDNYASVLSVSGNVSSSVTGSDVPAGSLTPGTIYQITALGTTTQAQWVTAGVPAGITAAVGVTFKAAATSSGTGTSKILASSQIVAVQPTQSPNLMLSNQPATPLLGGYIDVRTVAATSSSVTTLIPTDPESGSTLSIEILLNNSAVQ